MGKGMAGRLRRAAATAYFFFFISVYLTAPAQAYLDPATTAMITQIVAGAFITLGVVFGVFRRRIVLFFKNLSVKRIQRKIERENKRESEKGS